MAVLSTVLVVVLATGCSLFDTTSVDDDIVVPPGAENVALGKNIEASSVLSSSNAGNAVDGDVSSRWLTANGAPAPHWLVIDLGGTFDLYKAIVRTGFIGEQGITYPVPEFKLQYLDGEAWVDIPGAAVVDNVDVDKEFVFAAPITTSKVRFYTEHPGTASGGTTVHRIREIEIYGVPAS